jgi:hypothetical protein
VKPNNHIAAFVCSHVFDNSKPILLVSHENNGDWQFLCGGEHPEDDLPHLVGRNHLVERDETLRQILDLERGWCAERQSVTDSWERHPLDSE